MNLRLLAFCNDLSDVFYLAFAVKVVRHWIIFRIHDQLLHLKLSLDQLLAVLGQQFECLSGVLLHSVDSHLGPILHRGLQWLQIFVLPPNDHINRVNARLLLKLLLMRLHVFKDLINLRLGLLGAHLPLPAISTTSGTFLQ